VDLPDGPFAETKEVLAGYYIVEGTPARACPDERAAVRREAALIGRVRDFQLAEDAVREVFVVAAATGNATASRPTPGARLTVGPRDRTIDRLRRERSLESPTSIAASTTSRAKSWQRRRPAR
jgi:predicted RNA polymerase sigma factor